MPKDKLTDYSATNASNTDVGGVNTDEGMLPSAVNNAIREVMTHLKNFASGTDGIDVLSLADDTATNAIKLQAPSSVTTTTTLTLPDGDGTDGQVLSTDGSGALSFVNTTPAPNLIINGNMAVWQRGTSFASPSDATYLVDRFFTYSNNDGGTTFSQSTDVPSGEGFKYSLKADVTTADTSIAAGQYLSVDQFIEGQNVSFLDWGSSNAKSITISFWMKSTLTGTYCYSVRNNGTDRYFVKEFTIDTADTWEKKTITIAGDTTGTWLTTNGTGQRHQISLAMGATFGSGTADSWQSGNHVATTNQVNFLNSTSNNFYVTGWKVEEGTTATPFLHESYGENLAKCQRYFIKMDAGSTTDYGDSGSTQSVTWFFPTKMRATPTVETKSASSIYAGTDGISNQHVSVYNSAGNTARIANGEEWTAEL